MQAVWAWIQLQLAVGLLEHWATSTEASQVGTVAHPFALFFLLFMLAAALVRLCHASYIYGAAVVCTAMHRSASHLLCAAMCSNVYVTHLEVQLPNTAHAVHLSADFAVRMLCAHRVASVPGHCWMG